MDFKTSLTAGYRFFCVKKRAVLQFLCVIQSYSIASVSESRSWLMAHLIFSKIAMAIGSRRLVLTRHRLVASSIVHVNVHHQRPSSVLRPGKGRDTISCFPQNAPTKKTTATANRLSRISLDHRRIPLSLWQSPPLFPTLPRCRW